MVAWATRRASAVLAALRGLASAARRGLALGAVCALLAIAAVPASEAVTKEYQIKAAFLFNFTQFVEWPAETFPAPDTPIRIGILGEDPFGPALDETVRGETVRNRRLEIVRSSRCDDLKGCHLVFISASEEPRLANVLGDLGRGSILTVSDIKGFATQGGVIDFYIEGRKVRFEINQATARKQGLKMSSQLLRLGRAVGPETERAGD